MRHLSVALKIAPELLEGETRFVRDNLSGELAEVEETGNVEGVLLEASEGRRGACHEFKRGDVGRTWRVLIAAKGEHRFPTRANKLGDVALPPAGIEWVREIHKTATFR